MTRQATVTTKSDCVFAIIDKKDYRNCFERIDKRATENRIQFFQSIPYLKAISWKIIRQMDLYVEPLSYNMNQMVFQEGQKADSVIFIRSGSFELTRQFTKENECHLDGKKGKGPLSLQRERVKKSEKIEKVVVKNEQNEVSIMIDK